ncbi:MAG: hypothetical protein ACD_20C00104G0001 [uncultured bacterium]|nr:MAG: hypothetical protein ACD_20C00104G0001 [uncultured bacterium]HBH18869.1 hydroxyacid dehydrogenase [Cyanobacteria bacterium UBA9579]
MTKVAFLEVRPFEEEYIKQTVPMTVDYDMYYQTINEINKDVLKDADIISVFTDSTINEESLKGLNSLKMVNTRSTGVDHINTEYCKNNNIIVTNVPAYGQRTVAEFAFGLLTDLIRKITIAYADLQKGEFDPDRTLGKNLAEKTLGIIGTGRIGCHMAKLANAYEMKILAYDPNPKMDMVNKYGVQYISLDELLKNSDIITLHCPFTGKNYHMIDEEAFSKMKTGVLIINAARGELIDTNALLKALQSGKVAGAALDVLESEKIIKREEEYALEPDRISQKDLVNTIMNHELLNMQNVIITPHIAYETIESVYEILDVTMEDIKGYLNQNIVNKAA